MFPDQILDHQHPHTVGRNAQRQQHPKLDDYEILAVSHAPRRRFLRGRPIIVDAIGCEIDLVADEVIDRAVDQFDEVEAG